MARPPAKVGGFAFGGGVRKVSIIQLVASGVRTMTATKFGSPVHHGYSKRKTTRQGSFGEGHRMKVVLGLGGRRDVPCAGCNGSPFACPEQPKQGDLHCKEGWGWVNGGLSPAGGFLAAPRAYGPRYTARIRVSVLGVWWGR
jgi:hypothetical protein